jgi:CII-binding regulator of phage lambda lysogenization HflD
MGLGIDIGSAWDSFTGGLGDLVAPLSSAATASSYAPWIAGGATLLGSLLNNNTSRSLAGQQQAFSAAQAGSIYQRGAADLAAAGINPILAYSSPASMGSYTQPNIQPSLALAVQSYNSALDTHSSSGLKYSQQHYTNAQTSNEPIRGGLMAAQTEGTSSQSALTKMHTVHESEKIALTKLEQDLARGNLGLQDIQKIVMQSQAYLNSASAKHQLSSAQLAEAHSALASVEYQLKQPELNSVLDHPDLHEAGKTSGAISNLAKPLFDLISSVRPAISIKTDNQSLGSGKVSSKIPRR